MSIAWLFPGQGSQTVGMGKALYDASPAARTIFDRADAALGWSISKLCFEGPESELMLTANTQPAILTTSVAAHAALEEAMGTLPTPACAAGHSLGEYSALVAASALSLEDAVRTVHLRGQAMQQAVAAGGGAMAAIMGGDPDTVRELCKDAADGEALAPANFNAPGQVVIAGTAAAVARATALAATRKLKAIPLKVSAPFHCSLMAPAAKVLAEALEGVELQAPRCPIVTNVEATGNSDPGRLKALLVEQVDSPVQWEQSVRWMTDSGVTDALEFGAGKVLAGLVKRTSKQCAVLPVGDPDSVAKATSLLG